MTVVSLATYRARGRGEKPKTRPPAAPATLAVKDGQVLLDFGDGTGLELSSAHARTWAERLAAMADVAEALAKEGGGNAL